jgi:hypothetical protein
MWVAAKYKVTALQTIMREELDQARYSWELDMLQRG